MQQRVLELIERVANEEVVGKLNVSDSITQDILTASHIHVVTASNL